MNKKSILWGIPFIKSIVFSFFLALASTSWPTILSPESAAKTSQEIIERAKKGEPQDLFVALDVKEIREREKEKLKARNLVFKDRKLQAETNQEFDRLKRSVFVDGRLGDVYIVEDHANVPVVTVKVKNYEGLIRLLSHPMVESVSGNEQYKPA